MSYRNLSPQRMFSKWAKAHKPKYRFSDCGISSFEEWKNSAFPEVVACLGDRPEKVPLNPELMVEWEHDGLRKQRWMIDVGPHISAVLQINYPQGAKNLSAILCCHGHGPHGKEPIMGDDSSLASIKTELQRSNHNYGHEMAKAGFVTFAIDWIGFGERNDSQKPNLFRQITSDWCNMYYLHATLLGTTSLALNIAHGSAAIDFACTRSEVDSERIGVMGLSGGGTMSLWMKLCDKRLKAAEIICYSNLWHQFGFWDLNYCGMQIAPGLYKLVDLPDLQGLIAPDPLLIDIGVHDDCFKVGEAMACFRQLERIYDAAKAREKLELDLFPGGHAWGANKSVDFFEKYL